MINSIDAIIASGATESSAIDLSQNDNKSITALIIPNTLTGTALTFKASQNGTDFYDVRLADGSQVSVTGVDSNAGYRVLTPADFVGMRYVKVVSNASEAEKRNIKAIVRPIS